MTFHVPLTAGDRGDGGGARELAAHEARGADRELRARRHRPRGRPARRARERPRGRRRHRRVERGAARRATTVRRLIQHPRVVVTPHLGANSSEAQVNVAVDVAPAARGVPRRRAGRVRGQHPGRRSRRRSPSCARSSRSRSGSGRFSVQLDPGASSASTCAVAGAIAEGDTELLARAVLAGLLGPVMAGPVNLVNARLVARGARPRGRRGARGGDRRLQEPPHRVHADQRGAQGDRGHRVRRPAAHRPDARPRHGVHAGGLHPRPVLRGPARRRRQDRARSSAATT